MGLELFSLEGRVAIVTGSGHGIGRGIALEFAEAGANVVVASRTEADLEAVAAEIQSRGRKALAVVTDFRHSDQVDNIVQKTVNKFGGIDILVNNVGGMFFLPFLQMSENAWDAVIRWNLKSNFLCTKAVAKVMVEQKRKGSIINIASVAGLQASLMAPYGAAKAGVINLTKTLATELAPYKIRVNAIAPGFIDTPGIRNSVAAEELANIARKTPLGRLGKLRDVAAAAIYLASDAADHVTGITIVVDGGATLARG